MNKPIVILGKTNSVTAKFIGNLEGFVFNNIPSRPHTFINIGFQGKERRIWDKKNRANMEGVPFLNDWTQISKYNIIKMAEAIGIPVPETYNNIKNIPVGECKKYIIKNNWSHNSNTFKKLLPDNLPQKGEYIQRIMKKKTHDIRIIRFLWTKSTHINVEISDVLSEVCTNYTDKILKLLFGAVDFIYNSDKKILEFVNMSTCPLITTELFVNQFELLSKILKNKTKKEVETWKNKKF